MGFTGCAAHVTPPPTPPNAARVFVADYGRHSSIVLPDNNGGLVEFAFGDWDWFAANRTGIGNAFAAMLWSPGSCFGRRLLAAGPDQSDLKKIVGCRRLLSFYAAKEKVDALRAQLTSRFIRRLDTVLYNPENDFWFVRDSERYSLWHNCNHLTAAWLGELGCRVRGSAMLSDFQIQPRRD